MNRFRRDRYPTYPGWGAEIAGRAILGLVIVGIGLDFFGFDSYAPPSQAEIRQTVAAVAFTGSFSRVDEGLRLVNAGDIPRLYISGVNAEAGIAPSRFLEQFSERNPNIAHLKLLVECCVELGERAANTLQNAQETECWVERRGLSGALLLITSRQHMARAMVALSAALPSRTIIPYPVDDEVFLPDRLRARALEYVKYLATFFAVYWLGPFQGRSGAFAHFCSVREMEE